MGVMVSLEVVMGMYFLDGDKIIFFWGGVFCLRSEICLECMCVNILFMDVIKFVVMKVIVVSKMVSDLEERGVDVVMSLEVFLSISCVRLGIVGLDIGSRLRMLLCLLMLVSGWFWVCVVIGFVFRVILLGEVWSSVFVGLLIVVFVVIVGMLIGDWLSRVVCRFIVLLGFEIDIVFMGDEGWRLDVVLNGFGDDVLLVKVLGFFRWCFEWFVLVDDRSVVLMLWFFGILDLLFRLICGMLLLIIFDMRLCWVCRLVLVVEVRLSFCD